MTKKASHLSEIDKLIEKGLSDLKKKSEGGAPLTTSDLKVMGELRRRVVDDSDADIQSGPAWRWKSLSITATQLSVSERWLRYWISGTPACSPKVHHRINAKGKPEVRPAEAYEHIKKHARRIPKGLTPPHGYAGCEQKPVEQDEMKDLGLPSDPLEMMKAFFNRPELLGKISSENIKSLKLLATEIRQINSQEERSKAKLTPDDVVKMLRSFVQLFTAVIDETAAANATDILRLINIEFSIDLLDHSPIGRDVFESFFREKGNAVIKRLSVELTDRVRGIDYLRDMR